MSIISYDQFQLNQYMEALQAVAALSSLFSESHIPLLNYRTVELQYTEVFSASNLARSDVAIDAKIGIHGVGLKTFICSDDKSSYQKIAEFNHSRETYLNLSDLQTVLQISSLRNKRLEFAKNTYDVEELVYHCVIRSTDTLSIFEEVMHYINIENVNVIKKSGNQIYFSDDQENYKFDLSKSTLYKYFTPKNIFISGKVIILNNPINIIKSIVPTSNIQINNKDILVLPLYSHKRNGEKFVPERSGLNQWNANGRSRHSNEVYLPYPANLRVLKEGFFPNRTTRFNVVLPDGKIISMKVCQADGKAIMSNPNKDLGEWLLRKVLHLCEGTIVTYELLIELGIDSVEFEKKENYYILNFKELDTYEKFLNCLE